MICLKFLVILADVVHPSSDQMGSLRFIFWGALGPFSYLLRLVRFMKKNYFLLKSWFLLDNVFSHLCPIILLLSSFTFVCFALV
jgi:hypothetical protein